MSTDFGQLLNLAAVPADHNVSQGLSEIYTAGLTEGQVSESFRAEFNRIQDYVTTNRSAYANRRAASNLQSRPVRVISDVGRDQLFNLGLTSRGVGQPLFEWYVPVSTDGMLPFREDILFIVMHSFGRDYDLRALASGQRTVAIDPTTGHNPGRFFAGVRQLTNPDAATPSTDSSHPRNGIHHIVSLRGDVINSVPWDNMCYHGEGNNGQYPDIRVNPRSIGIQHEEWYAFPTGSTSAREIEDHGPYNDGVYAADAFILKKLETFTGRNFKSYLGVGNEARTKIRNGSVGCFNHAATSNHQDPGGEFFLPPDYELRVTDLNSLAETRDAVSQWQIRLNRWYRAIPDGTRISAYARIFDIASRLRNYNLQTEVFDPARTTSLVTLPQISGSHMAAAAQQAANQTLSAVDRAARLVNTPRTTLYNSAQETAQAVTTALARQSSRLSNIAERAVGLPVITNALGFDFTTGLWVNRTSVTRTASPSEAPVTETTQDTTPAAATPPQQVTAAAQPPSQTQVAGRVAIYGSSSSSPPAETNALIQALNRAWSTEVTPLGVRGATANKLLTMYPIPDFSPYTAVVIYLPGTNGADNVDKIRRLTQEVAATASGRVYWVFPPNWPSPSMASTPEDVATLTSQHTKTDREVAHIRAAGVNLLSTARPNFVLEDLAPDLLHLTRSGAAKLAAAWPKPQGI